MCHLLEVCVGVSLTRDVWVCHLLEVGGCVISSCMKLYCVCVGWWLLCLQGGVTLTYVLHSLLTCLAGVPCSWSVWACSTKLGQTA